MDDQNITQTHPLYDAMVSQYNLINDCCSATGVKDGMEKYLPFVGDTTDERDKKSYQVYWSRAPYVNFSQQTVSGLVGLAFRDGVTVEKSGNDYILTNLDGNGVGLEQLAKRSSIEAVKNGRAGLLVDYPPAEIGLTSDQVEALNLRATITTYDALSIIDWDHAQVGGASVLTYVALKGVIYVRNEDMSIEEVTQERRLYLEDGLYVVRTYEDGKQVGEDAEPVFNGARLNYIPFYFIGSENNDSSPDQPPMYPICDQNLAHYRNNADMQSSLYYIGNPQPWAAGLTDDWVEDHLQDFTLGSGRLLVLPELASFGIAQISGDSLLADTIKETVNNLISLGAKMINSDISYNTATEAKIATASENSRLKNIIDNVASAYSMALETLASFNNTSVPTFAINTDLNALTADQAELAILKDYYLAGIVPAEVMRDRLRKVGLLDKPEDEILELLESEAPALEDISDTETESATE